MCPNSPSRCRAWASPGTPCWRRRGAGVRRAGGCGDRAQPAAVGGLLAPARRGDRAGAGARRRQRQARHLGADLARARIPARRRRRIARVGPGAAADGVRPSGRRQPALQRGQRARPDRKRTAGPAKRDLWRGA
ncbi:hypothetical protein G6F61_014086 [Rhizopus arrhizus]|nr:hypothetical protein G6F61_014086 [Rhizopus arrhizus]